MAEIRKRGDTFQITVFLGRDENGKKITTSTTYSPKAKTPKTIEEEVKKYADRFEERAKLGEIYEGERMTFAEIIPAWKESVLSLKSPKQREQYEMVIEKYFLPKLRFMKLSSIRAPQIDAILKKRIEEGRAPRTVQFSFTAINSVFQYAYKKAIIKENPCSRCDELPSGEKDDNLHFFTVEQAKTFFHALTLQYPEERETKERKLPNGKRTQVSSYVMYHTIPFQWRAYFSIAIYGGLRRGEIVSLTWEDVNFEEHSISISKSISHSKAGEYVKGTKTKAGTREIVLPAETFALLTVWRQQEKTLSEELGSEWKGFRDDDFDKNWIFIDLKSGNRMSVDTPTHKFREILDAYNKTVKREEDKLPIIRLHDLRHTSATLLLANGTDILTVSKRLGHSRASITLDIYAHALKEKDVTASTTLERLFA